MSQTFARRVFLVAGIYGIAVLAPQYFMEGRLAQDFPPPLPHRTLLCPRSLGTVGI